MTSLQYPFIAASRGFIAALQSVIAQNGPAGNMRKARSSQEQHANPEPALQDLAGEFLSPHDSNRHGLSLGGFSKS